jgi:pyruvate/2-oxoglutarate dehydrogenase complex dihydrolipoamide dehydrogenase (E3) component
MGVEVRFGQARFVDPHTLEVEGEDGTERVTGRFFVVAAGASASVPPIPGVEGVPYLTNESLFELEALPQRLAIVGGGPIGTEMAQAFSRFGSSVTVIDRQPRILSRDDEELAAMLQEELAAGGVAYVLEAGVKQLSKDGDGVALEVEQGSRVHRIEADAALLATGRRANTDGLGLDAAGVGVDKRGITVDDRCRTGQRHIYAVGDVTGRYQFTHMSEHMAKVAVTNALLRFPMKIDEEHVPWVTFTDPELGHVGATEKALQEQGTDYEVYRFPYSKVDRAVTEHETTGLIKVYARQRDGKIYGADVLGSHAGELICEYAVAMRNGVTLRNLADTIHPYPTYGLGARRAADQWYVRKQSPTLVRLLQRVFGYRGPVLEFEPGQIV